MKKILLLASAVAALILAGCASSDTAQQAPSAAPAAPSGNPGGSIVGKEGVTQPDWVYATPDFTDGIYATGSAKMPSKNVSIQAAQASARTNLAMTLETSVKAVVESYLQSSGVEEDMQTEQHYMNAAVQKASQLLRGSTQKGYWIDQDGTTYVLMFVPYSFAAPETAKIIKEVTQKKDSVKITEEDFANAVKKYNLAAD